MTQQCHFPHCGCFNQGGLGPCRIKTDADRAEKVRRLKTLTAGRTTPADEAPHIAPAVDDACGVSHAQAMEIGRRFYGDADAAPTIAHAMSIEYETVCAVLGGRLWPGVRRFWMDKVLP